MKNWTSRGKINGLLVDSDYRAHLISASYRTSPDNIITQELPADTFTDYYEPEKVTLLNLPRRFTEWVLPANPETVNITCVRIGGHDEHMKFSQLTFCAETEMRKPFECGKPAIGDFSIRLCVSPFFPILVGGNAVIGKENTRSSLNTVSE